MSTTAAPDPGPPAPPGASLFLTTLFGCLVVMAQRRRMGLPPRRTSGLRQDHPARGAPENSQHHVAPLAAPLPPPSWSGCAPAAEQARYTPCLSRRTILLHPSAGVFPPEFATCSSALETIGRAIATHARALADARRRSWPQQLAGPPLSPAFWQAAKRRFPCARPSVHCGRSARRSVSRLAADHGTSADDAWSVVASGLDFTTAGSNDASGLPGFDASLADISATHDAAGCHRGAGMPSSRP